MAERAIASCSASFQTAWFSVRNNSIATRHGVTDFRELVLTDLQICSASFFHATNGQLARLCIAKKKIFFFLFKKTRLLNKNIKANSQQRVAKSLSKRSSTKWNCERRPIFFSASPLSFCPFIREAFHFFKTMLQSKRSARCAGVSPATRDRFYRISPRCALVLSPDTLGIKCCSSETV